MTDISIEDRLRAEINAHRRTEERLRRAEDLYENAPAFFCSIDARTLDIIKCNTSFAVALGFDNDEIVGLSMLTVCKPSGRDLFQKLIARTETEEGWPREEIVLMAGARELLASIRACRFHSNDGEEQIRLVLNDVTGPRRRPARTEESQEQLETIFRSSPDFLCLVNREFTIELINRVEVAWRFEDVIGAPIFMFFDANEHETIRQNLAQVFDKRETLQWDATHVRADGTLRHFNAVASPVIVSDTVTRCVVALRDTSARVQLQNEKRELEEQVRQSQKMEAIGRLAGGIAHDFNNILTAIMGYTSIAQLQLAEGDPLRLWVDEVSIAASRAADLTRQLLAFSRRQVVAPKVIDLGSLTQNLVPMLRRLIGETVDLRTELSDHLDAVLIDPSQAEQILLNLVINASDAMADGGEVLVETAVVVLDEEYCKRNPKAGAGKHVMLAVSDTGCGMTLEVRERIFEPFFTTKEQGSGTGLGLATVFGIVEQANGWIDLYSEVGLGSSFKIYFPCVTGEVEALAETPTEAPMGSGETILLVEDEDMVRNLAIGLLMRLGYAVVAAANGEEALSLCDEQNESIGILVTDVVMPGMNGRQLANKIREKRPGLRVLYTSGYPQDIITHQGVLDEGVYFLPKPYSLESLAVEIRKLIECD